MPLRTARAPQHMPGKRLEREAALRNLRSALKQPLDLVDLFRVLYRAAHPVLDTDAFYLATFDQTSRTVEVVRQMVAGAELPGGTFPLGDGFTSRVIRTGQPLLIRHWSTEAPPLKVRYATADPASPESGVTVPVLGALQRTPLGVLTVQSRRSCAYDTTDLHFLSALADQAGRFLESQQRARRAELQLLRKRQELEAILAGMRDAVIVTDAAGALVRLNAAARELLGDPASIVFGQPLDQDRCGMWPLGTQALADTFRPLVEDLRRGVFRQDVEVSYWGEAGQRILSVNTSPLRDPDGRVSGVVLVIRDVTARRALERLKDHVLSVASHDLRTPVSVMRGQAQLLQRWIQSGRATQADLSAGLDTIIRGSDRLVEMLGLLLDLSTIEGGQLELVPRPADLVGMVREVAAGVPALSTAHSVRLETPETVEGIWDLRRLQQVVQNLVSNAVKYSPAGGVITIGITTGQDGVKLWVSDPGVGIAEQELPRLFDRLYRAEGTRHFEGSGLGLYICQAIVAAHGGRMSVRSEGLGCGSTFEVALPRAVSGPREDRSSP